MANGRDYGFGGGNQAMGMLQQMLIKRAFGDTTQEARGELALQQLQASITPLSHYERNFDNKWSRTITGSETVEELNTLKISNRNLYKSMTKNMSEDKKIPITDSYNSNNLRVDKQIKLVNDYDKYKERQNTLYGQVETALFNNMKTLDQLGSMYAKGFDNWEDVYSIGTEKDVDYFRKNVQPYMEKNGENISKLMQDLVAFEKQFPRFQQFSDSQYVGRDIGLLRNITSKLGQELKTTTFLTDKEAGGLLDMWKTKDMSSYLDLKTEQKKESDQELFDLKAVKKTLLKRKTDLASRLATMGEFERTEDLELGMSAAEMKKQLMTIENDIKTTDLRMLKTGEIGAATGLGGNVQLNPIHPATIKAVEGKKLGIPTSPPPPSPPLTFPPPPPPPPSPIVKFTLNFDEIRNDYSGVYKYNFNRTPDAEVFKNKYGLNNKSGRQVMSLLKEIEQTERSSQPKERKDKIISSKEENIKVLLKDVEKTVATKKNTEAIDVVRRYTIKKEGKIKATVSDENIKKIKEVMPEIDLLLKGFFKAKEESGSKFLTFRGWLENTGNKEKVNYEKLAGIL